MIHRLARLNRCCLLVTLLACSGTVKADLVSESEAGKQTMSKFMINLAKFVTWPEAQFNAKSDPYRYCVMGNDPFRGVLEDAVIERKVKQRSFKVKYLNIGDISAAKHCHVVFLNVNAASQAVSIIRDLASYPILTVGEVDLFAQNGGMVGFMGKGRKVALAVNQKRLEASGLKASSRLYRASTM